MGDSPEHWQEIGWDGVTFQLPAAWQATAVRNSYLFFEQDGQPAFEIKWKQINGSFSPDRTLNKIQDALQAAGTVVTSWDIPPALRDSIKNYSLSGFKCVHDQLSSLGLLLFCPSCKLATILRFYGTHLEDSHVLQNVLQSFSDHNEMQDKIWAMYDIRALLPARASLKSPEFLAGRYTLSFELDDSSITLYRFKPAAALLNGKSLEEFGSSLSENALCTESADTWATWKYSASGLDRLAVILGRKTGWIWLRLWHIPGNNVILGVKGSGKKAVQQERLDHIVSNFTALDIP